MSAKPRDGMRVVRFLLLAGRRDAYRIKRAKLTEVLTVNIDRYLSGLSLAEIENAFHAAHFLYHMESDPNGEGILRSVGNCLARTHADRTATRH